MFEPEITNYPQKFGFQQEIPRKKGQVGRLHKKFDKTDLVGPVECMSEKVFLTSSTSLGLVMGRGTLVAGWEQSAGQGLVGY